MRSWRFPGPDSGQISFVLLISIWLLTCRPSEEIAALLQPSLFDCEAACRFSG